MNLKRETLKILQEHGHTAEDILWVGCKKFAIPVSLFWKLADQEYDSGYGGQEVATDLVVVGDRFWLERHEYDGSEWWENKEYPCMPRKVKYVKTIMCRDGQLSWSSLEELNRDLH